MQGKKLLISKEVLEKMYWEDGLTGIEIGKKLGYSYSSVYLRMKSLGIQLRDKGISMSLMCKKTGHNRLVRNPAWKGGRIRHHGYIRLKVLNDDPFLSMADKNGYCLEHRYVMAKSLNRILLRSEHVHHKNGIKDDNRIDNLQLVSPKDHTIFTELCKKCEVRRELKALRTEILRLKKMMQLRLGEP